MSDLLDIVLLIVGLFTTMSLLLFVLVRIDPQTNRTPIAPGAVPQTASPDLQ